MAYAALVSLSKIINDLLYHHNDQYPIPLHVKQQIMSIHEYILSLLAFLEDFPEKATCLEWRIKDVANEAEDIIEYFMSEHIQLYHTSRSNAGKFLHHLRGLFMWLQGKHCGICTKLRLHFNLRELTEVARGVKEIKSSTRTKDVQLSEDSSAATSSSRLVAPTCKDGTMVGFDDDLMAIKARLCGESQNLEVIPIFGMGGIGKTTLARNAYDDSLSAEHFDVRAWVTVSQDYSAQEILSGLLISMKVEVSEQSIGSMVQNVYQHLTGRRYLIVMDDMWSTKVWDDVNMIFPDECKGSRIILTTRLYDVATYPNSSGLLHEMHFMDEDQSWNLLEQKVFAGENCPAELETIGKMLARSCRGLPLAIVMIAGLLLVNKTQTSWEYIAKYVNLAINTTNNEQFSKILSLSYFHLPHYLRPCLLYMGAFPEDYEIRASKLIKLWVAEGFLKPSGSKSFEEVAEEYLENLAKRSLVLVTKRKYNGKIKSCSLHDLVRDLCIRKAQDEKFHLNLMNTYLESKKNLRHVSIASYNLSMIYGCSTIRTISYYFPNRTFFLYNFSYRTSLRTFSSFRLLRVLNVVGPVRFYQYVPVKHDIFPAEIFKLFHLRYLAFTYEEKIVLPPSILNLHNLQTLNIHSQAECCLPMEIWRMRQLRHLIFKGPLPNIPQGAAAFPLENLQTLSKLSDFKCTEEVLKMIPNLKTLEIIYFGKEYVEDGHLENLVHLHQLEKLKLEVHIWPFQGKLTLVFPNKLKELTMSGCILHWKDMSIVGSLLNLEVLKLKDYACYGDKWETSEGEFPQLKFLLIQVSNLQQWVIESSHFPSLKCLKLYACRDLNEIPNGIGDISTLELIEVDSHNKSLVDSAKRIQEEQQENCGYATFHVRLRKYYHKAACFTY